MFIGRLANARSPPWPPCSVSHGAACPAENPEIRIKWGNRHEMLTRMNTYASCSTCYATQHKILNQSNEIQRNGHLILFYFELGCPFHYFSYRKGKKREPIEHVHNWLLHFGRKPDSTKTTQSSYQQKSKKNIAGTLCTGTEHEQKKTLLYRYQSMPI